jgi:methionine-gamma-lyase
MEGTETANVSASGMGAITPTLLQLCGAGDHIVRVEPFTAWNLCFLEELTPRMDQNHLCRHHKLDVVEAAITADTKVLCCETVSNPY